MRNPFRLLVIVSYAVGFLVTTVHTTSSLRAEVTPNVETLEAAAALRALLDMTTPPGPEFQPAVPWALSDPGAVEEIVQHLGETDFYLQLWALEAACRLHFFDKPDQTGTLAEELVRRIQDAPDPRVRAASVMIEGCHPEESQAIARLRKRLQADDHTAIGAALELVRLEAIDSASEIARRVDTVTDTSLKLLGQLAVADLRGDHRALTENLPPGL